MTSLARIPLRQIAATLQQHASLNLANRTFFTSRPVLRGPRPDYDGSSAIATSSKVTVDDFPLFSASDPVIVSLNYATDQELISAMITKPPPTPPTPSSSRGSKMTRYRRRVSPYDLDWTSSVDPAFAFLALRTRPTFQQLISHVRPQLSTIYQILRPSGMHQLLASDLLLLHQDTRVLRDLLEIDANAEPPEKHLRASVIASIYAQIGSLVRTQQLEAPSVQTYAHIMRAVLQENRMDMIQEAWNDLCAVSRSENSLPWEVFQCILHLAENDQVDEAFNMTKHLLEEERVPISFAKNLDVHHPESELLFVQTICLRSALQLRKYGEATSIATKLLNVLERSEMSNEVVDSILEACRVGLVGRQPEDVDWAQATLVRLIKLENAPPLPSATLNTLLDSVIPARGMQFYLSLPDRHHPPSPRHLVRLANVTCKGKALIRLLQDINKLGPDEFIAQRPAMLHALIRGRQRRAVHALYGVWKGSFPLTADLMVSMVELYCQSTHSSYKVEAEKILVEFKENMTDNVANHLAVARGHIHLKAWQKSHDILSRMEVKDPEFIKYMDNLISKQPLAAYMLMTEGIRAGLGLEPPVRLIITACMSGKWRALRYLKANVPMDENAMREIQLLKALRKRNFTQAWTLLEACRQVQSHVLPDGLYYAFISRCLSVKDWAMVFRVWEFLPEHTDRLQVAPKIIDRLSEEMTRDDVDEVTQSLLRTDEWRTFAETTCLLATERENIEVSLNEGDHTELQELQNKIQWLSEQAELTKETAVGGSEKVGSRRSDLAAYA